MDKDSKITDTAPETEGQNTETETPGATRRRLLKAGVASVPVIVSLRSGVASAQATGSPTCGTGLTIPGRNDVEDELGDALSEDEYNTYFGALPQTYDQSNPGHNLYLQSERESCFDSLDSPTDPLSLPHSSRL